MSFLRRAAFSVISVTAAFGLSVARSQELVTNGTFTGCVGGACSGWTLVDFGSSFYNAYFNGAVNPVNSTLS